MSEELEQGGSAGGESLSFLDQAINATSQTAPDRTKELLTSLTQEAMSGTVTWDKNLTDTIANAVAAIDKKMSAQLSAIMQQEEFKQLEGSWLGLQKLIRNSALGTSQKVKLLNISKDELLEQFEDAPAVDRSPSF